VIFSFFKKSRFLLKVSNFFEKVVEHRESAGIKRFFSLSFAHLTCLFVEKEGEGFVVFLNHRGGNLTTIIITIKDF
jgi:hypothetical protein